MTTERYKQLMSELMKGKPSGLTYAEMAEGWHFCQDWDGLLVGPECAEAESCYCQLDDHRAWARRMAGLQGEDGDGAAGSTDEVTVSRELDERPTGGVSNETDLRVAGQDLK